MRGEMKALLEGKGGSASLGIFDRLQDSLCLGALL
jgi:hypothetical protein